MKSSNTKRVGVMIPCFNQGHFLSDSIGSLKRQTYPNWQAVVVDDASTDGVSPGLCEQVASDQVKVVLLKQNLGRALVRNECLRHLNDVDFVLVLDCDDYLSDTYIEELVAALESAPEAGIAFGTLHYFGEAGFLPEGSVFPLKEWSRDLMYFENVIPGSGTMFNYSCLNQLAGWRKDFTVYSGEDYDIWMQAVEAGWEPLWVKDAVYHYRQHATSYMANRHEDMGLQVDLRILKHHFNHIESSIGVDRFLNFQLMPAIFGALRRRQMRRAVALGRPLMTICPGKFMSVTAKYYWSRLRSRVPGNRERIPGITSHSKVTD